MFDHVVKLREGCLPLRIFLQHMAAYPRLGQQPAHAASGQQQDVNLLDNLCYRGPGQEAATCQEVMVGLSWCFVGSWAASTARVLPVYMLFSLACPCVMPPCGCYIGHAQP